jgi:hypothetical protein
VAVLDDTVPLSRAAPAAEQEVVSFDKCDEFIPKAVSFLRRERWRDAEPTGEAVDREFAAELLFAQAFLHV